jgi:DNA-binding NtrC family response regulator
MDRAKILIVDDNKSALSALRIFLQFEFDTVETLTNPNSIPQKLNECNFDVVLLDMNFTVGVNTGTEGLFWLQEIKKISPDTEVVSITAYGDVELAVKALKLGATDFVLKPWENEKLLATIKSACRHRRSQQKISELKSRESSLKRELNPEESIIVGESVQIRAVQRLIAKVAGTDANILITGENGTGKELVAREIHRQSSRAEELLVSVDMGAIPETLFESELFGHKKGSFTDAREDRTGKFQLAHKGSLFLDEIGNLPLTLQSKLLAVLQNREITPIGSNAKIPVDIRLISATNSDMLGMVADNKFREDLLYRLNTIQIEIPPLRERGDDVELLAAHFLKIFEKKYNKSRLKLGVRAIAKLKKHTWPGNVRELQHTIEKAVILCESEVLSADDFIFSSHAKIIHDEPESLEEMERRMIESALDKCSGNLSAAAQQLGITRQTLYNKIKKYDI